MILNGSQILIEVLVEEGIRTIFGYPGGSLLNIYDALYMNKDRIEHILTVDECGACHAADGYARASGKVGVVLATSGPGATNLVTPLATAYMDSVPLVAITGNVTNDLIGKDSFQEVYIAGVTMPVTKHNFVVRKVEDLADTLRRSFEIALSGRKGPVLVDIPKDVTIAKTEFIKVKARKEKENKKIILDKNKIDLVADMINKAKRPVIYFGGGASNASENLRELMTISDIPSVHTIMASGILGYDEPLNLGLLGMHGSVTANKAIDKADVVLAIGTRFSDRVALNTKKFASKAKIIHIDIDASEINKNVKVDFSIVGDINEALDKLLKLINKRENKSWIKELYKWKKEDYKPKENANMITPYKIIDIVCSKAGKDAIYVTDVGQHQMWAAQYIHHIKPRSFLTSGGLGTMGFGYGASIGAKVATKNRHVIHITGDGSFHMNMNETATAVTYNLPIISIIMNNHALGMVRQWQTCFYDKRYSNTDINRKTDYVKVAEGFGAKGFRCTTTKELEDALDLALKEKIPVWIECIIDKDEKVLPMIPSGGTVEDIMVD